MFVPSDIGKRKEVLLNLRAKVLLFFGIHKLFCKKEQDNYELRIMNYECIGTESQDMRTHNS